MGGLPNPWRTPSGASCTSRLRIPFAVASSQIPELFYFLFLCRAGESNPSPRAPRAGALPLGNVQFQLSGEKEVPAPKSPGQAGGHGEGLRRGHCAPPGQPLGSLLGQEGGALGRKVCLWRRQRPLDQVAHSLGHSGLLQGIPGCTVPSRGAV